MAILACLYFQLKNQIHNTASRKGRELIHRAASQSHSPSLDLLAVSRKSKDKSSATVIYDIHGFLVELYRYRQFF